MTSAINTSTIDTSKPVHGRPETLSVRNNTSAIKNALDTAHNEITDLQAGKLDASAYSSGISDLKGGVSSAGDTLKKLYDLIASAWTSVTANVNFQDFILQRPELKDYSETVATPSIATNTLTLDLETGNVFNVPHNANINTLTISNPPASGKAGSFTLMLTQDATGGRTVTFPALVKWSGGTAPTLSTTPNKKNILTFFTVDAGTTWFGSQVGKDY